jgi:hypothetical protein
MRPLRIFAAALAAAGLAAAGAARASACVELFENGAFTGGGCEAASVAFETVRTGAAQTGAGSWVYAASGSVSLASGTMRSVLDYGTVGMDGSQPPTHIDTRLADTVTFLGSGSTDVTFEMMVHGAYVAQMPGSAFSGRLVFRAGTAEAWMQMQNADPASPMAVFGKIITAVPEIDVRSNLPENTLVVFRVAVPVTSGVPLPVSALLQLQIEPMDTEIALANFNNTSTLAIHMPDGWTFTSQSGVLLAVPEPPAPLLMALGIGGLLGSRRLRRKRMTGRQPLPE